MKAGRFRRINIHIQELFQLPNYNYLIEQIPVRIYVSQKIKITIRYLITSDI